MAPRPLPDDTPRGRLTHNPFAKLRPEGAPARPEGAGPERAGPERGGPERGGPAAEALAEPGRKLVVRREKRGRGGKTVTRVAGLALGRDALDSLARELKRALGCGASVDGGDVLLQGAQTERAAAWLRERFGAEVVVGN